MTNATKHTPGPWESYPHSTEPVTTIIGNRTDGIAKVLASGNRELDTANARLIAAAPELLAAAKNAVYWALKQHAIDVEEGKCTLNPKPGWILSLQAEIAKAEGRA